LPLPAGKINYYSIKIKYEWNISFYYTHNLCLQNLKEF